MACFTHRVSSLIWANPCSSFGRPHSADPIRLIPTAVSRFDSELKTSAGKSKAGEVNNKGAKTQRGACRKSFAHDICSALANPTAPKLPHAPGQNWRAISVVGRRMPP